MIDKGIRCARREDWAYAAYSLNIRLYRMAGNQPVVDGLAKERREKFR